MDVRLIKTIPGEELIVEFISESHDSRPDSVTVSRPRVFQMMSDGKGGAVPTLTPWYATAPDYANVPISKSYIVSMIPAPAQIEKAYAQAVSGIDLSSRLG